MESWQFPRHVVDSQSFAATVDGSSMSPAFEVFEGSGVGHADADVVYCGTAHPEEVAAVNLQGKIALLDRDRSYHRSAQYSNVAAAGAVAMLYNSAADGNLIQVGSVRFDGGRRSAHPRHHHRQHRRHRPRGRRRRRQDAARGHRRASARRAGLGLERHRPHRGPRLSGMIVLGAHYDTWFTGSSDNGGGIAALLAIAKRRSRRASRTTRSSSSATTAKRSRSTAARLSAQAPHRHAGSDSSRS